MAEAVNGKKILITGGAGYIGSILVGRLLQAGHEVVVIDNFLYNQTSLLNFCFDQKLTIVRADARKQQVIADWIKKVDIIIPLACITGAPACENNQQAAKSVNYDAIKLILDLRSSEQKIIFPTTNSGYGIGQEGIFCTEQTPLNPISSYGKLKVAAEKLLLDSGNCISLRLATVFGISPRMRTDLLVNDFVYRAVSDKVVVLFQADFKRNYIHLRDVAAAFIHCLNNFNKMKDQPYNVGLSSANISKKELCREIKKQLPDFSFVESEIGQDPDQRNYIVSNEKIEKAGFQAKVSLAEGIAELIKGYQVVRNNQYTNL